jgi:hypothetical protein
MLLIELGHQIRCILHITRSGPLSLSPKSVFVPHLELKLATIPATVDNLLHLPLLLTINDFRLRRWRALPAMDRVGRREVEFDNREDRVSATHPVRKL